MAAAPDRLLWLPHRTAWFGRRTGWPPYRMAAVPDRLVWPPYRCLAAESAFSGRPTVLSAAKQHQGGQTCRVSGGRGGGLGLGAQGGHDGGGVVGAVHRGAGDEHVRARFGAALDGLAGDSP